MLPRFLQYASLTLIAGLLFSCGAGNMTAREGGGRAIGAQPAETVASAPQVQDSAVDDLVVTNGGFFPWKDEYLHGGPAIWMMSEYASPSWPVAVRFKAMTGAATVRLVAAANGLTFSWFRGGHVAVLHGRASEEEIERVVREMRSVDAGMRQHAVWLAGWITDPRILDQLAAAAKDSDVDVILQALRSAVRLNLHVFGAVEGEHALPLLDQALQRCRTSYDAGSRKLVLEVLGEIGGGKALALVTRSLADDNEYVRRAALVSFGAIEKEKALPVLERAFNDKDIFPRCGAAEALGRIGGEQAMALLERALFDTADRSGSVYEAALESLGRIGGGKALDLIENSLQEKNENVRMSAATALGHIKGERALALLERIFTHDTSAVRSAAAAALCASGDEQAITFVATALESKDPEVRRDAVCGLDNSSGNISLDRWRALIQRALVDDDSIVRTYSCWSLGKIGDQGSLAMLSRAISDEKAEVRDAAVDALGASGNDSVLPLLERAFSDEMGFIRKRAFSAIGSIKGAGALALLQKTMDRRDSPLCYGAVVTLGEVGGEQAFRLIENACADSDDLMKAAAAEALGKIGGVKALALLEKAVAQPAVVVRCNAVRSLGMIGGEQAFGAIAHTLDDPCAWVRTAAVDALSRLGGDEARASLMAHFLHETDANVYDEYTCDLPLFFNRDAALEKLLKETPRPQDVPAGKSEPPPPFDLFDIK